MRAAIKAMKTSPHPKNKIFSLVIFYLLAKPVLSHLAEFMFIDYLPYS